jgi:hypothetical protein
MRPIQGTVQGSNLLSIGSIPRAALNEIRTLNADRDPEFLETLRLVREITQEMEGPSLRMAA